MMIRPIKIRYYLKFMAHKGFNAGEVLTGTAIDESLLDTPNYLIGLNEYQTVISNILLLTGKPHIGLEIGHQIALSDLGVLGYSILSARDGRTAAEMWQKYSQSVAGTLAHSKLVIRDDFDWEWQLISNQVDRQIGRFAIDEAMAMITGVTNTLVGLDSVTCGIYLPFDSADDADFYEDIFDVTPQFNQPQARILFNYPSINVAVITNDVELHHLCVNHCENIKQRVSDQTDLLDKLRLIFLENARKIMTIEEAADGLNISLSSFRRYLSDKQLNYRDIVSDFKRELACEYLISSRLTPKEIGFEIGYKDTNAFRRAFKQWTGMTIKEFQENNPKKSFNDDYIPDHCF